MSEQHENTKVALQRIQNFDCNELARTEVLGQAWDFVEAIEPAKKIVAFYNQLPVNIIEELPDGDARQIQKRADATYNLLSQIMNFDSSAQDAMQNRTNLLNDVKTHYDSVFQNLINYISYAVSRTVDFDTLENQGRAAVQAVQDQASEVLEDLKNYSVQAESVLEEVRTAAAEQGVSQKAKYFKEEAELHDEESNKWKKTTNALAIATGFYAILALFVHKIDWIAPQNNYETVQLLASKIIIFFVLAYLLSLSAKNFLSHKHNSIINKHRQNALMTFNALVEASEQDHTRDVILNHAASCIFMPQDSGYTKNANSNDNSAKTIVEMLPRTAIKIDS